MPYRTAWNRCKAGKIEGANPDEHGFILVPKGVGIDLNEAAIYARVSDPRTRTGQLLTQELRCRRVLGQWPQRRIGAH